jgi:hypothetical protein
LNWRKACVKLGFQATQAESKLQLQLQLQLQLTLPLQLPLVPVDRAVTARPGADKVRRLSERSAA